MSTEGDKAAVFRTTKVRTKIKGDSSWLQRHSEPQAATKEEKPWIAEVRAYRVNGAPVDTSPVTSPTKSTSLPNKSDSERGVFTKLDDSASSSTSNGFSGTTQLIKKPSESYKKIAPYTLRSTSDNQEDELSKEEQEKRTEAASSVLKKSAVRQRSYVLSAAKKFESKEEAPDTSLDQSSLSFVAKRVEITDDDENAENPAPTSTPPPSPVVPVASVVSAPEPKPQNIVDNSVKTAVNVTVNESVEEEEEEEEEEEKPKPSPEPMREEPSPVSTTETDPFEHMKPGCTKVATPLPELIPECVLAVCTVPEPEDSDVSGKVDAPLIELAPALPTPLSPTTVSPAPDSTVPESPAPVSAETEITVKTEPEPEPELYPKPSSSVDTLTALSDTLISFDTSSTSFKDDEPALPEEEEGSADSCTTENGVEEEPVPVTDDLLALSDGPETSAEPVPPSPGRWSQDLLSGLDSESDPAKTSGTLDLLANDVIPTNTEEGSLSMQQEEEKQTDETSKEMHSSTETVTTYTNTVISTDKSEEDNADPRSSRVTTTVTESSSTDPFDPYPIGTTSPNSSSDLLLPISDISINSASPTSTETKDSNPETNMSSNALESLADDVIPINTDTTSTQRSWAHTWETSTPQQADTEESQEAEPEGQDEDQKMLVMFERKSTENDSPWDRWTSPIVYTITTEEDEDEEEDESPEEAETETVAIITTIRETQSEPEPTTDRYETNSKTVTEDQLVQTPELEAKKGFVYVKEYVNATEMSLHNARDTIDGGPDYLTSSPSTYSSGSLSSTCTYCGQLVGNDAKISIEHLNINCHPDCFKCDVCSKPMGDLLDSMFLHGGKVNCESCYSRAFE
uniref:zinc finger protein 185 isoform X2 n=1 Tax=Scatophagus argus TaxID=75038 RepID=UPI001ED81509|nr:zinc finger protein 185 isoform X2 [Scatophagus argus]